MLQHWRETAGGVVHRFPFTIGCCLFGLALVLALRPVVLSTAGSAATAELEPAPVRYLATSPASATALPGILWEPTSIAASRVFGIPSEGAPRVMVERVGVSAHAVAGDALAAEALGEWADALTLVDAVAARPSQASHDLAR